jgi:hypothetical protein
MVPAQKMGAGVRVQIISGWPISRVTMARFSVNLRIIKVVNGGL